MFLFCLVFAMSLCASVYMCFVVTCWERADLLALVCGVYCEFVTFPLVSWVRCGTWLYRFLIFEPLLTLFIVIHFYPHLTTPITQTIFQCDSIVHPFISTYKCVRHLFTTTTPYLAARNPRVILYLKHRNKDVSLCLPWPNFTRSVDLIR